MHPEIDLEIGLKGLEKVDWHRNSSQWLMRAINQNGRIITNKKAALLIANVLKNNLDLPLSSDEESAEKAEAEKNRSEEKETVEWAAAQSVADNDIGQVTSGNLEHYMDSYIGEDPEGVMDYEIDDGYHGIFLVEFTVSGNKYTVDENGMVYEGEELNRDGIELPDNLVLNVGESVKLEYTTESENVTWSNSDDNIAELGEGDINWQEVCEVFHDHKYGWTPEIWNGHHDNGQKFCEAHAKLNMEFAKFLSAENN